MLGNEPVHDGCLLVRMHVGLLAGGLSPAALEPKLTGTLPPIIPAATSTANIATLRPRAILSVRR